MNDIKEKEQLHIVPLATLLMSGESRRTDRRMDTMGISYARNSFGHIKREGKQTFDRAGD
jgi:hypothetical protein